MYILYLYFILSLLYLFTIVYTKIFRRKDIKLTGNRVIRICIQNTPVPPIAGYFYELCIVYNVNSYLTIHF